MISKKLFIYIYLSFILYALFIKEKMVSNLSRSFYSYEYININSNNLDKLNDNIWIVYVDYYNKKEHINIIEQNKNNNVGILTLDKMDGAMICSLFQPKSIPCYFTIKNGYIFEEDKSTCILERRRNIVDAIDYYLLGKIHKGLFKFKNYFK